MDKLTKAVTNNGYIRIYALNARDTVQQAADFQGALPLGTAALGRLMCGGLMMGAMQKDENTRLTLQMKGGGPLGITLAVADTRGNVKGYIAHPDADLPLNAKGKIDVGGGIGTNGYLSVIRDMGMKEPYIGQVPIQTGEIGDDLAYYFAQSEQVPSLVALGVGVIIGAGLFSITGTVAAGYTGPAITLSFAIAALGCCFAGLCYAEFASMIPVAGSAYTYSYATMGELIAWIIGWDLVLEYTVAATTVSISWSRYLVVFLEGLDIHLPQALTACPWDGGVVNIPAFLIVVLMSLFLIRGTEGSSIFNGFIVFLKVSVILIFVILGWKYINTDNYTPYIPANTGILGEYGFSGILRGAAIVFFAFLGFDAVSTAAQETKNPKRNMPIGILVSLLVCTVLYMVFAHVMTGVAHYTAFSGQQGIAPVAIAIEHMGQADAAGIIQPDYPWLNRAIVLSILFGYCSVIMVTLLGQSRVFLSMSHDGLLPPFFSHINEKFRTPARSNLLFMVLVGLLAAFVPARLAGEMTSIGTLMAFTLVCAAVLVVRRTMPDVPRSFKTPLVPLIPILGILTCLCMMLFLPADTWIRLVLWMLIGLDIYVGYGMKHSKLEHGGNTRHGQVTLNMIGLILAVLCVITGLWHQQTVGWGESKVLLIISFVFAFTHCAYYMWRIWRR